MSKVLYVVHFEVGSVRLSSSAKAGLEKIVTETTDHPIIIVDAYADPSGSDGRNLALTTARATSVQEYMMTIGYPPHKLLIRARGDRLFERADLGKPPPLSRRVEVVALS
jgi:outer membrane protein OmpA-like peptidoglycan-associated protein